jgi:aldose 1-epimerase
MYVETFEGRIAFLLAAAALACSGTQPPAETAAASQEPPASNSGLPPGVPGTTAQHQEPSGAITEEPYGKLEARDVKLYTLKNSRGFVMKVATYGATITELHVPDRSGALADVVLGFDRLEDYVANSPYFGATVGRVANRIRNAKFELAGKAYALTANNAPHHLHGGAKGFDKAVWSATTAETPAGPQIRLTHVSKDGEEGYPGTVTASTVYTLTNEGELRVEMEATTDAPTLVNLAHHTYWNLGGHASGSILEHELTLFADRYTPGDPMVPTGALKAVEKTPFDFRSPKPIGKTLLAVGAKPAGFDHNFVVNGDPNAMRPAARLREPKSGRVMTIEANQPGIQFYSGNFLDGTKPGKAGVAYGQHAGLCLETQKFPNAVNVPAWKPQVVLEPGQTYRHVMVHRFGTE